MNTTITASYAALDNAIQAARQIGAGGKIKGMAAPLGTSLLGSVNEAWETIEAGLKEAFLMGREKAIELIQVTRIKIEGLLQQAGQQAAEVHRLLLEKIQGFLKAFINSTIALLPGEISAGGRQFPILTVTLAQRISLGGKLELSLTKVFEMVSEGELEVEVEYGHKAW